MMHPATSVNIQSCMMSSLINHDDRGEAEATRPVPRGYDRMNIFLPRTEYYFNTMTKTTDLDDSHRFSRVR